MPERPRSLSPDNPRRVIPQDVRRPGPPRPKIPIRGPMGHGKGDSFVVIVQPGAGHNKKIPKRSKKSKVTASLAARGLPSPVGFPGDMDPKDLHWSPPRLRRFRASDDDSDDWNCDGNKEGSFRERIRRKAQFVSAD